MAKMLKPHSSERLIGASTAAALCDVSLRTWWRYDASGQIPRAVQLGTGKRTKRWRLSDVIAWIDFGCPSRSEFEARRNA